MKRSRFSENKTIPVLSRHEPDTGASAVYRSLMVVLMFEAPPVELIRLAQGLAVVAFPILGFLVLAIARDREIMGEHVSTTSVQAVAVIGYITIIGIVLNYVRLIIAAL